MFLVAPARRDNHGPNGRVRRVRDHDSRDSAGRPGPHVCQDVGRRPDDRADCQVASPPIGGSQRAGAVGEVHPGGGLSAVPAALAAYVGPGSHNHCNGLAGKDLEPGSVLTVIEVMKKSGA